MKFLKIIMLFLIKTVLTWEQREIDFSLDYFAEKRIKYVCWFDCDTNSIWDNKFARALTTRSIAGASIKVGDLSTNLDILGTFLRQHFSNIGVLIDANCPHIQNIFYYASLNMYLDENHKWLIIDNNEGYSNITQTIYLANNNVTGGENISYYENSLIPGEFENLNVSVDADITLAILKEETLYDLYEIFNFGKIQGGNLIVKRLGTWNPFQGLDIYWKGFKYYQRFDFNGCHLRVVAVIIRTPKVFKPEMILESQPYPNVPTLTKCGSMILDDIAKIHNIEYVYKIVERWIGEYQMNSTRFVTNSLYFREQDVSAIIREDVNLVDKISFLPSAISSIETRYFYRIPTKGAGKFENQFLRPLTAGAWGCVVALIACCASVLILSAKIERRSSFVQYGFFSAVAAMCQQFFEDDEDNENRKGSTARKLTVFVTGICCVLVYNYYTSSVVSWLLNGPPPSINSLEELLQSPLELIYEDIGYSKSWLNTPGYYFNKRNAVVEDKLRQKVFNKKQGVPLLVTLDHGIELMKAGGYAFHTQTASANDLIARSFTQSELCELGSLQSMEKTILYPCLQKNSPYLEFFKWSLMRLHERGVTNCIQKRTDAMEVKCEGSSPRALALGGAAPAFIMLFFGYVIGFMIMIIERIVHRHRESLYVMSNKKTHGVKLQKLPTFYYHKCICRHN